MRQVIIGVKNGEPYVISAPKKLEIIIKQEKRRSIRKVMKTIWYKATH